jgi:low temperature requirement protein LtrA
MFKFELISNIIIFLLIVLTMFVSYFFIRRIRNKPSPEKNTNYKAIGILEIIFGFIVMVISIIYFVLIQKNINNTIEFLRPISAATSEPVKLLLIALFLAGLSLIVIGNYCIRFTKNMLSSQ